MSSVNSSLVSIQYQQLKQPLNNGLERIKLKKSTIFDEMKFTNAALSKFIGNHKSV